MKNRMFLAVALSLAVLFLWQAFVAKVYHIDNKAVTVSYPLEAKNQAQVSASLPLSPASSQEESPQVTLDKFETDKLSIEFINPGLKFTGSILKIIS